MRFFSFLSIIPFLPLALAGCAGGGSFVSPSNSKLVYEGRVVKSADSVSFCYPGTSVRADFTGASISAELKCNSGYYLVEIDSIPPFKLSTYSASNKQHRASFLLADSLGIGRHSLQLTLVSEGIFDKPQFYGFSLSNPGSVVLPRKKRHTIEFIGDSQTCGYGVEAASQNERFADSTSNEALSFAGIVARRFDAEPMVVARSGIGVYRNYNDTVVGSDTTMPSVYGQTLIFDSPEWDFSSFSPEIVCLCLGTNDMSAGAYSVDLFQKACLQFVERLSALYPKSKLVLVGGAMLQGSRFADQRKALDYVAFQAKAKGGVDVYRFDFTPQDGSLGYGADWHPSARQHLHMANELSSFLESVAPGWKAAK